MAKHHSYGLHRHSLLSAQPLFVLLLTLFSFIFSSVHVAALPIYPSPYRIPLHMLSLHFSHGETSACIPYSPASISFLPNWQSGPLSLSCVSIALLSLFLQLLFIYVTTSSTPVCSPPAPLSHYHHHHYPHPLLSKLFLWYVTLMIWITRLTSRVLGGGEHEYLYKYKRIFRLVCLLLLDWSVSSICLLLELTWLLVLWITEKSCERKLKKRKEKKKNYQYLTVRALHIYIH